MTRRRWDPRAPTPVAPVPGTAPLATDTGSAQDVGRIRPKGDGPDEVWVELEFTAEGEPKDFSHVSLEIRDGEELPVGYAPLRGHPSGPEHVRVGFLANRADLDKVTL